ncbi:hypothetical protein KFL_000630210 [Klebsormidium nitens]|uniref:MYND-type domain-containing protein n=1 Tax=Klebsormidium nitens TaxID=105231 RepID=A0A1Y1HY89_KLENI|nr:hypothetical protein KFL_000630210 [Klebsormidium nitens]|eukprot:GAQ80818.1 hypothetical protein KFL_000630210 [Klebsormidium nitens]
MAMVLFRQFKISHELHGGCPSSAALVLELLCRNNPELLTEQVLPKLSLLVEVLEIAYSEASSSFSDPPASTSPVQAIDDEQQDALCAALAGLVAQLLALGDSLDLVIKEVARSKGVALCKRVLRCKRATGTAYPPRLAASSAHGDSRATAQELEALVQVWEKMAKGFDLKPCSNTDCQGEILESVKKTFKKCSACGMVQYCSQSCQRAHWRKEHKVECKAMSLK